FPGNQHRGKSWHVAFNHLETAVKYDGQETTNNENEHNHEIIGNISSSIREHMILQAKALHFQYDKHQKKILDHLSLDVYRQEWLTIVGGNGSGKSTL